MSDQYTDKDVRAQYAWTTTDKETGDRWDHFKTVRLSDGVTVGQHVQCNRDYGLERRWISGTPHYQSANPNDCIVAVFGYASLDRGAKPRFEKKCSELD